MQLGSELTPIDTVSLGVLTAQSASGTLPHSPTIVESPVSHMITVRSVEPHGKSWLRHEAPRCRVSMEALVRQIIHERRDGAQRSASPADAFKLHFGREHGVELPCRAACDYRPVCSEAHEAVFGDE